VNSVDETKNPEAVTAISIVGQGLSIFKNVDFSGLNRAIDSLGDSAAELSTEEKKSAIKLIDEWQSSVVNKLHDHNSDMSCIINFFDPNNSYYYGRFNEVMTIEKLLELCNLAGVSADDFLEASNNYEEYKINEPERPLNDPDLTETENQQAYRLFEYEKAKFNIALNRLSRIKDNKLAAIVKALAKTSQIKELLENAKGYNKKVRDLTAQCSEKTQIAKLNVTISSKSTRDALRELLQFETEI
jgi:hypothetical protein